MIVLPFGDLAWVLTLQTPTGTLCWVSHVCVLLGAPAKLVRVGLTSDAVTLSLTDEVDAAVVAVDLDDEDPLPLCEHISDLVVELAIVAVDEDGTATYDDRYVVQQGRVADIEPDVRSATLSLSIEPATSVDASDPFASGIVDARTWPLSSPRVWGQRYPVPYGRPGGWRHEVSTGTVAATPLAYTERGWQSTVTWTPAREERTTGAVPLIAVDREEVTVDIPVPGGTMTVVARARVSHLLLSGLPVSASTVNVWARSPDSDELYAEAVVVDAATDGLGRPVALLDISGTADAFRDAGQWWASFAPDSLIDPLSDGGGWAPTAAAGRGAVGDLLLAVLQRGHLPVDTAALYEALPRLNTLRLGGYVDEPVSALAWAQDRLAPLGWRIVQGPAGLTVRERWPTQGPVVARLVLEVDAALAQPARWTRRTASAVTVRWGADQAHQLMVATTYRDSAHVDDRAPVSVSAPEVWDDATAGQVALVALMDAAARCTIELDVETADLRHLRPGDVVMVEGGEHLAVPTGRYVVSAVEAGVQPRRRIGLSQIPSISARRYEQATIEA